MIAHPGCRHFGAPGLWHNVERQEEERVGAAKAAREFLIARSGTDADVDLVHAFHGSGGETRVEDPGVGAGQRLGDARERFGRGCGGALGNFGRNGTETDGVYVDDLPGVDRSHIGLRPVLMEDCAGAGNRVGVEGHYDLWEIERGMIAGGFGLDAYEAALGLYVPRDDDAPAGGRELRHRDFTLADPH